ncbi:MAG TPA: ABC transporter ATP-binding protein [Chitinophagaceae bacterium]|nr:ABC transporter ATP-binding protein [Chitinophagaceae bacterium]
MGIVIKVEHLSKRYIIRHQQKENYTALRDVMAEKTKKIFNSASRLINNKPSVIAKREEFWALKDVNFEVNQGDRIGIIGRNGAGKSTLLKILSRITEPTNGKISIKGRIASLLEVGTGFHPELTGRENIYLNGAILGMYRTEIKRKFDEIVDFSGVEKFLDTPVKRYSSGMYVRLAFAVAAHLESEILIVDEVLAVGDADFQKKCLGKMQDISRNEGRTVLFVSHNTQAITNLCSRVILLNDGSILQNDETAKVIRNYLTHETASDGAISWNENTALGDSAIKLMAIKILDHDNNIRNHFFSKSKIKIEFDLIINELNNDLVIGFDITDEDGIVILRTYQNDSKEEEWPQLVMGRNIIYCELPAELLNAGTYYICPKISLHCKKWILNADPLLSFEVELNHGVSPFWNVLDKSNRPGSLALIIPWKNNYSI